LNIFTPKIFQIQAKYQEKSFGISINHQSISLKQTKKKAYKIPDVVR